MTGGCVVAPQRMTVVVFLERCWLLKDFKKQDRLVLRTRNAGCACVQQSRLVNEPVPSLLLGLSLSLHFSLSWCEE